LDNKVITEIDSEVESENAAMTGKKIEKKKQKQIPKRAVLKEGQEDEKLNRKTKRLYYMN
jgi:hypothetical protein